MMLSKIDFYALVKPVWLIFTIDVPECDCVFVGESEVIQYRHV